MAQAGLDPAYLDKEFPDYRTLPRYKYFFDERRRGVATDVLKQRMIAEHLDENVLDVYDVEDIHTIRVDYQQNIEYFRRKEAGENVEALQVEMEKAGLDSSILVHDVNTIEFYNIPYDVVIHGDSGMVPTVEMQSPVSLPVAAASAPATCQHKYVKMVDYQYSKKFKLVAMGRPIEQVKMRMEQEGMDPSVLDLDMNTVGFLNIPEGEEVKYPDGHVEPCCKPGDVMPAPAAPASAAVPATCQHKYVKMVDYQYSKKFKLVAMGRPIEQVKMRMEQEGMDPSVLDLDMNTVGFLNIPEGEEVKYPDGHVEPCCKPGDVMPAPAAVPATCQHKYVKMVDYQYSKKFKLVAMGRPIEQVKMRMEQEGMDPSVLDLDMNTVGFLNIPEGEEVKYPDGHVEPCCKPGDVMPAAAAPATCQHKYVKMVDYQYSKKFKLVAMGRPIEQVKMRMEQEGMDPSVLDLDMNTVGFLNIPEGEEVKYPDGHVEPCCKPGTAPAPTPVAAVAFSASSSSVTRKPAARQSMVKPKEETLAPRPKFKHEAKLRPLYWDVLTSKSVVEKSMWFQMNDRDIKLDTAMLDTEFTSKPMTFVLPVAEETKTSDVVNLLDPKREQNVGIAIGRLKVSTQQLHHALLFGDFSVITRENISQLVNAAPTEDEQAACLAFSGDEKKLSSASRFAYELSDIPMVAVRFECCKTIITFDDEVTRIRKIIQVYEANEKMMMNSTGIKQLMKLILAIGNYLNGESARGGAWGFKINLLSKLSQTKTADGTKTLMT